MKLLALIACISLVSVAVFARDLSSLARKERVRRQSIHAKKHGSRTFNNDDLDTYALQPTTESTLTGNTRPTDRRADRDLRKEESMWRDEKLGHDRELARLDANIRRLEWRLRERQQRSRTKARSNRLDDDTGMKLLEESLESLREERKQTDIEFRERARKAGAFPGWLR